jgi:hypothetical protein
LILDEQLKHGQPTDGPAREAYQDEVYRSTEFLCQCGALLNKMDESQERCQRETWTDSNEPIPLFLISSNSITSACLRRASPRPGSDSSGLPPTRLGQS